MEPTTPPIPPVSPVQDAPIAPVITPEELLDTDLVYIDPSTRSVIAKVEWKGEKPVSLPYKPQPGQRDGLWRKFYHWGTFKSMRRIYKVGGKIREQEPDQTLDEVLPKALSNAFWN